MADIFTEALKKLDKELGGNKIGNALDEAAGAPQPKKEETKAVPAPKPPVKPADPLAGLSNDELKKKLAALNEQLKQVEAQKAAKLVPAAPQALERTPVNRITKVDDFDIDEYITNLLKEQASAGQ